MVEQKFNFPVYATQGGGLARRVGEVYVFVTDSDCPGLGIGEIVPQEWDLIPANGQAQTEMSERDFNEDDFYNEDHQKGRY